MRYLTTLATLFAAVFVFGDASGTLHPEPIDAVVLSAVLAVRFLGDAVIFWLDHWEKRHDRVH